MIRLLNITGMMLAVVLAFSSCEVRMGEDPCPVGRANIHLFAEAFQNPDAENPLHKIEDNFYYRIGCFQYFLYKDGSLLEQEKQDVSGTARSHALNFQDLEYGDYRLIVVANCKNNSIEGTPEVCSSLRLRYPGNAKTEDFFYRMFDFKVDSEDTKEYDLGLYRAHGFARLSFENLPDFIDRFRIRIGNVTLIREIERRVFTDKHDETTIFGRLGNNITPAGEGFIVGTFPTMKDQNSEIFVDLFDEDDPDTPCYTECAGTTLNVVRNQLLDIRMIFNNGDTHFEISLDTEWNGALFPGNGGAEID